MKSKGLACCVCGLMPAVLPAVEVGNFEGSWSLAQFSSPTRLREAYLNSETGATYTTVDSRDPNVPANMILVDAWYSDPVRAQTKSLVISANGTVSGGETGTVISLSRNRLLYRGEDVLTTVFANPAGDVLVESKRELDYQDMNIALKEPQQLTVGELAGSWNLVVQITPDDLTTAGNLGDVYFIGESSMTTGTIVINPNGSFTGPFSGSMQVNGTGVVADLGLETIPFRMNEGKNLMIATVESDDEAQMIFLVRKPDTLTTADLAGGWRFNRINIPNSLTEVYYNMDTDQIRQADSEGLAGPGEVLVDLFHEDAFELERGNMRVQTDGTVLGSQVTSVVAGPNETVLVTANGEILEFFVNEDRSVMVGGFADERSQQLIVVVKNDEVAPESDEEALDLIPVPVGDKLYLSWAGATGTKLEVASDLGSFGELEGTLAQDAVEIDFSAAPRAFFRLVEEAPPAGE